MCPVNNLPCSQCALSTMCLVNNVPCHEPSDAPCQHTLCSLSLPHTLSIHPVNLPCQQCALSNTPSDAPCHEPTVHPSYHTPCQHILPPSHPPPLSFRCPHRATWWRYYAIVTHPLTPLIIPPTPPSHTPVTHPLTPPNLPSPPLSFRCPNRTSRWRYYVTRAERTKPSSTRKR